jgi:Gas vesicle protein
VSSRDLEQYGPGQPARSGGPAQLADVLERVLDKGIVIAGDIRVNLLDIELLTVKLRLLIASADKAKEMGVDWWEGDPFLRRDGRGELEQRLRRLEEAAGIEPEAADRERLPERSDE